jgi:mono/diheme cytochrome c family protein
VRPAAALIGAVLLAACGDARRRADQGGDTAAAQSAALTGAGPRSDTATGAVATPVGASPGDSAATPTAPAAPQLVLRADSASGDSLFHGRGRCLTCHGARGEGLPNLGADLRDSVWLHGDGSVLGIERTILGGVAKPKNATVIMPSFAALLQPLEVHRLAAYVYSLSHPAAVVADTMAARDSVDRKARP